LDQQTENPAMKTGLLKSVLASNPEQPAISPHRISNVLTNRVKLMSALHPTAAEERTS
jgi:hypothetical protein